jgi:type IX secretion system substrate protein
MKKILLSVAIACAGLTSSYAQAPILSQTFESGIAPWTVTTTGAGSGWVNQTGSIGTQLGIIPAHGHYGLVNEAVGSGFNNPTIMTSPTFSLVGATSPYLAYDFWYVGALLGSGLHEQAWVQISTDGGTTYSFLDSVTKQANAPMWATKFVSLGSITATATCVLQFCFMDQGGHIIGVAIDNILVYSGTNTDIGIASVSPVAGSVSDYYKVGSAVTISGVATNYSTNTVGSFTANYQVGSGPVVSTVISSGIPELSSTPFSIATPYTMTSLTAQSISVWVTTTGDGNSANDSAITSVVGVAFMPKKREVFEEGTGSWCGYCVRGLVFMDSLWKIHPDDVSIISVHDYNGYDPMAHANSSTTAYDAFISSKIGGYPSMVIDRRYTDDPSGALTDYSNDASLFGFANMGVTATTTGGNVNATVTVQPAFVMSGKYQLEMVIEEDKVTGTGSGYSQHDYYSYQDNNAALSGCGYNFQDSLLDIAASSIKYPFVARMSVPNSLTASTANGVVGSLPSIMHPDSAYTYTFAAVPIGTNGPDNAWVAANLRVVILLIDNNPANATYGQVLNSVNSSNAAFSFVNVGVANVSNEIDGMKIYPNPTSGNANVVFDLKDAATVHLSIYDVTGRQLSNVPAAQMNAGHQQMNISTGNLPSGIYNVVIRTENGTISQRLSVVK